MLIEDVECGSIRSLRVVCVASLGLIGSLEVLRADAVLLAETHCKSEESCQKQSDSKWEGKKPSVARWCLDVDLVGRHAVLPHEVDAGVPAAHGYEYNGPIDALVLAEGTLGCERRLRSERVSEDSQNIASDKGDHLIGIRGADLGGRGAVGHVGLHPRGTH